MRGMLTPQKPRFGKPLWREAYVRRPASATPPQSYALLDRDRHPDLALCLSMIFSENRCTLFRIMQLSNFLGLEGVGLGEPGWYQQSNAASALFPLALRTQPSISFQTEFQS
jgi:hypothetical protein